MTKWVDIDEAFEIFIKFLTDSCRRKESPDINWHVVFSCGSVVRLNLSDEPFEGYADSSYNFPSHRLIEDAKEEDFIAENERIWNTQKREVGLPGKALRIAFKQFIDDGYPYPGGQPADRIAFPMSEGEVKLWMITWYNRNTLIYNLILETDMIKACYLGGDLRKHDYIQPKVYAIVSPDLTVVKL